MFVSAASEKGHDSEKKLEENRFVDATTCDCEEENKVKKVSSSSRQATDRISRRGERDLEVKQWSRKEVSQQRGREEGKRNYSYDSGYEKSQAGRPDFDYRPYRRREPFSFNERVNKTWYSNEGGMHSNSFEYCSNPFAQTNFSYGSGGIMYSAYSQGNYITNTFGTEVNYYQFCNNSGVRLENITPIKSVGEMNPVTESKPGPVMGSAEVGSGPKRIQFVDLEAEEMDLYDELLGPDDIIKHKNEKNE